MSNQETNGAEISKELARGHDLDPRHRDKDMQQLVRPRQAALQGHRD